MFQVMLVDDKEVFRRRIKRLPYWNTCGEQFLITYEAENGLEALDIVRGSKVDVVITDIKMPFVDGIELLKQIHNEHLCKCVILLSEYADFEYAKQGILNGAFDYILKPVDNKKITDAMERAHDYLVSTQEPKQVVMQGIRPLVNAMIKGDTDKITMYSKRIWESIEHNTQTEADVLLAGSGTLKDIVEEIQTELPYLSKFIWFEEYTWMEKEEDECSFPQKITNLAMDIQPFLVKSSNPSVSSICRRVLSDIEHSPELPELSSEYHMNVKYLGELFKKEVGQGYVQYVLKLKMTCAGLRLKHTEDRIYEIAYDLGYNDLDYFSKSFKKIIGVSPKAYRKNE